MSDVAWVRRRLARLRRLERAWRARQAPGLRAATRRFRRAGEGGDVAGLTRAFRRVENDFDELLDLLALTGATYDLKIWARDPRTGASMVVDAPGWRGCAALGPLSAKDELPQSPAVRDALILDGPYVLPRWSFSDRREHHALLLHALPPRGDRPTALVTVRTNFRSGARPLRCAKNRCLDAW